MDKTANAEDEQVTLMIEDQDLKCNKRVLREHSDYFKAMFEDGFAESDKKAIRLQEVDLKAMGIILELVERKRSSINDEDLLLVLSNACMLQFENVVKLCVEQVLPTINKENCLEIWPMTERLGVAKVALRAKNFALKYFSTVKDSESLLGFDVDLMVNYLSDDYLRCDNEMDVFHTCMRWLAESEKKGEMDTNDELLLKLLTCVRYGQLDASHLREIKGHSLVQESSRMLTHLGDPNIFNVSRKRLTAENLYFWFKPARSPCNLYKYDFRTDECAKDNILDVLQTVTNLCLTDLGWVHFDGNFIFLLLVSARELLIFDRTTKKLQKAKLPCSSKLIFPNRTLYRDNKIYVFTMIKHCRALPVYNFCVYDCKRGMWMLISHRLPALENYNYFICNTYKNQLLFLTPSKNGAVAYIFDEIKFTWSAGIEVVDEALKTSLEKFECDLINHDDSLYLLLRNQCLEANIVDGKFTMVSEWALNTTEYSSRSVVLHENVVYILYFIHQDEKFVLETMCPKTHHGVNIFSKKITTDVYYDSCNQIRFDNGICMFVC